MDFENAVMLGLELLQQLIKIPSVSGSGRENASLHFFAAYARKAGLRQVASQNHNSMVLALPGRQADNLLLLSHLDVAPAGPSGDWQYPAFCGRMIRGEVWGRGAVDCKGLAAAHFAVMLMLRDQKLQKGIVLAATADEEKGGQGARLLVNNCQALKNCRWALGEGGGWLLKVGKKTFITCQTGEKGLIRAKVPNRHTFHGSPSLQLAAHLPASCRKLIKELTGIPAFITAAAPRRLLRQLFKGMRRRERFSLDATELFHHTCLIEKADAREIIITCRVLPGGSSMEVLTAACRKWGLPPEEAVILEQAEPTESPAEGELYKAVAQISAQPVLPLISPSWSDSRWFRSSGIPVYGFFPGVDPEYIVRQHRPNERLSVNSFKLAVKTLHELVISFCT